MPIPSMTHLERAFRFAFGALVLSARALAAQHGQTARADSALAADDRDLARRLYENALATNPNESRVVFRLAGLEPSRGVL